MGENAPRLVSDWIPPSHGLRANWRHCFTRLPNARYRTAILSLEFLLADSGGFTGRNFEAIAARIGKNGEILIYVMSDDNFSVFQQTLLLVFALKPNLKNR